jgi:chitinase
MILKRKKTEDKKESTPLEQDPKETIHKEEEAQNSSKKDNSSPKEVTKISKTEEPVKNEVRPSAVKGEGDEPTEKIKINLNGYFQSWDSTEDDLNLNIMDVRPLYKAIHLAYATLDCYGVLHFPDYTRNVTAYEVRQVRDLTGAKVLMSVGGGNGNFQYLDCSGNVNNFVNCLKDLYVNWYVDGINLDIQQVTAGNKDCIVKALQWFKSEYPKAIITLTGKATYVCPDVNKVDYDEGWNCFVPIINEVADIIDWIEIRAFDYKDMYNNVPKAPVSNPPMMLEYIFNSYVNSFDITTGKYLGKYKGFDPGKLVLGVLASMDTGLSNYVSSGDVNTAIQELQETHKTIGGAMIWNINYDALNNYQFSQALLT